MFGTYLYYEYNQYIQYYFVYNKHIHGFNMNIIYIYGGHEEQLNKIKFPPKESLIISAKLSIDWTNASNLIQNISQIS